MAGQTYISRQVLHLMSAGLILVIFTVATAYGNTNEQGIPTKIKPRMTPSPREELNLKDIPFKIVYETYRETEGRPNWELYIMNADGSEQVNLTNTHDIDEMYPHVSGDGTKICFVADEGSGRNKERKVYYMNIDGTGRVLVAENARQPCWSFDGKKIAFLRSEYERYSPRVYATGALIIYDLQTGQYKPHPNNNLYHIYALCWSPDGDWFTAAVHGGMEYSDNILAFEADGTNVYDLGQWGVKGCRPDFGLDGKKLVWGETDWNLCLGDLDLTGSVPEVKNVRDVVKCTYRFKVYHIDLSPDDKYIAFSYGPTGGSQDVGGRAKNWDICVSDLSGKWVKITTDGNHNKEPDWVPIQKIK